MINKKTKGQIESQISEAIIKFEMEHMGRGSDETKTYIIKDMIFIRLKGVLTIAEKQLAKSADGALLVKQIRSRLLEISRNLLAELVKNITGIKLVSMHTDISTKTGERVIVFTLNENLEDKFQSIKKQH